jgi:hypothetical protein
MHDTSQHREVIIFFVYLYCIAMRPDYIQPAVLRGLQKAAF